MDNNTLTPIQNQVVALAGLLQSVNQVHMIARQGQWNNTVATACIHSLFQFDAASTTDVYGGIQSIRPGLLHLKQMLMKKVDQADVEVTRYALTLMQLEGKLQNNSSMLDKVRTGLLAIGREFDISNVNNDELLSRIAAVYVDTISTIPPKVKVEGNRQYLVQEHNTHRVRAMLFAGIRSAVLWSQLGGSRWKLFFNRKHILDNARILIEL